MTDLVKGFTITLEKDIRIDDIEDIKKALLMIKGVIDVEPSILTHNDHMIRERVKLETKNKFIKFLQSELE